MKQEQIDYTPTRPHNPYWDDSEAKRISRIERMRIIMRQDNARKRLAAIGAALFTLGTSERLDKRLLETPLEYNLRKGLIKRPLQRCVKNVDELL